MALLDFYRRQYGSAIKAQGNGWNGPCPLCGGEPGNSDRFTVWPERTESLGSVCSEKNIPGIWYCRRCGESGDTIAYLMKADGLEFKEALAELGIEGARRPRRRPAPITPRREAPSFTPRAFGAPSPEWRAYAEKLLEEATDRISKEPLALKWLAARGITAEAVKIYRLGYLQPEGQKYPGRWRYRSALGLAPKTKCAGGLCPARTGGFCGGHSPSCDKGNGTVQEKIFIPRGIVIPSFGPDGSLSNLRIRRHKEDLQLKANGRPQPKYMELEGSCQAPMLLPGSGSAALTAWFVTEAELDAILIHHTSGGVVGSLAVRTNRGKPDEPAHARLRESMRICVALDYDEAGANGVDFWEQAYPHSVRWPTPEGKDPGDAFALGVNIRAWIAAALPPSVKLPSDAAQCGETLKPTAVASGSEPLSRQAAPMRLCREASYAAQCGGHMDSFSAGPLNVGGGAQPEKPLEDFEGRETDRILRTRSNGGLCPPQSPPVRNGQSPYAYSDEKATDGAGANRDVNGESVNASSEASGLTASGPAAISTPFTPAELSALHSALPSYLPLENVPPDILRAWLLWRGLPVKFTKFRDENNHSKGFSWDSPYEWRQRNRPAYDAFMDFQSASRALWRWMSDHVDLKITSRNLLHVFGKE